MSLNEVWLFAWKRLTKSAFLNIVKTSKKVIDFDYLHDLALV